jgi:hypothetical protein
MATRSIVSMEEAHNLGRHKKLPRQKCPACRRIREAQWQRDRETPKPPASQLPWLAGTRYARNV